MRKYLLMMAMPFIALSAFASGEEKPTLNADRGWKAMCTLYG